MNIQIDNPIVGKLTWETPRELEMAQVNPKRIEKLKLEAHVNAFLTLLLLAKSTPGEGGEKLDEMVASGVAGMLEAGRKIAAMADAGAFA